jgi:RNase H-fold protein (predicted Holliday junction resolvase)
MRSFIKQVLVFVIPVLLIAIALEVALRHIPNDYDFKYSQLEIKKAEIKTLILGSSHSMYGFNPDYFSEPAYNLGHVSQTMDLDYYLLKKYIKTLPKLETVLLRLSYTTLHEQLRTGPEDFRLKDYELYYNLEVSHKLKYNSEVLSVKLKNNLSRLKDYYLNHDKMITVEKSGWASFEDEHAKGPIEILGISAAKKHTAKDNALVDSNIVFLDKFVKLCKENDVNVVLVTLPAHKSYVENLKASQLNQVISAGETMAKKYNNCIYLNLLEDQSYTEADFYDADHLNSKGSKKLSLFMDEMISKALN